MAQPHYKALLEKALLQFITEPDPFLAMLQWVMNELMRIEAEQKVGAAKGKHQTARRTHFSGTRIRRMDTRLGTVYLLIPKVRKGGYVPFFVSQRRRSEEALISVVQEAFIVRSFPDCRQGGRRALPRLWQPAFRLRPDPLPGLPQ